MYRKLKRTWSSGYANHIPNFKRVFPELSKIDSEELCDRLQELNMDFYYEQKTPINPLIRLTLPFALIVMLIMIIVLPINFFLTGSWGYRLKEENYLLNWFRALKLQ